ncbi:hypothetical protein B0H66DRAFT_111245 [Apodospora peruviana]|uniref:Zn(2)-C6 fungal-type domain-containing protein n=1 Tax=Apodospora peruviana TaxID=516989 RepID=A0AAE0MA93_9PEZI|nr:hypothetical protein B0H66DRAFT_111245 [Apodospora peruviana]
MDPGPPDTKRPRLSTGSSSWSAGGAHHGVSLLHPTPSPTTGQLPHHPPPSTQYQHPSPHSFPRPPGPPDHRPPPPPPPPPPHAPQQPPIDDRRHHEPERYPPMHELRQPPHSPAHPPYSGYPPRDPLVKPDPGGDDTLPHLRRPHSTGNAADAMSPGTPHSGIPPQPYPDDKRHMSFDNGPQPPMYRQPSYPPQTPMSHSQQPYDYPPQYGPPHGELPYGTTIHIATATGKRKAVRASQACDMCRQLKAKCDELKPCKSCKEKKVECKYREAVPKQQDKVAADILDSLIFLRNEFSGFSQRISRLEHAVKRVAPSIEMQPDPMDEDDDRPMSADSTAHVVEDAYSSSPGETMTGTQAPIGTQEARTITRNMEDETEPEPGPYVRPGVPAIPLNHTTLAALLLKWRSIQSLVQRYLDAENVKFVDEFPIRQEERRGLLRVWGRGEGLDSSRVNKETNHDLGMMEVQDDYSDAGVPSPADCWGGITSGSPGPSDNRAPQAGSPTLDFTESKVWAYVESYQDNIQNMHPLIIPRELQAMVRLFLDGVRQAKASGPALFVKSESTSGKRKRSSPGPDAADSAATTSKPFRPTFQRSINNALVLLVLALGKICAVKDRRIPDVVPVSEHAHGSPLVRNGTTAHPPSPSQGSPPSYASHSQSSSLPSPKENPERSGPSRRASFQGVAPPSLKPTLSKRNMDVIPGLDYFAYATDILGGQLAGTSLRHIHAYILAGLYHGQLGRVMESYAYIKEAGWALQIKMRPSLDRFKKLQEMLPFKIEAVREKSDNQLVFAFWTCLQLESDIIAELPLPQSHILAFEDIMPYPNINLAKQQGFDEHILQSYLAQLYLRKSLNQIHQMLYNPENQRPLKADSGTPTEGIINYIQDTLDMRFVPPEFKFKQTDPPASDILAARLRAKYWGAQVITYRPFIRQILELSHRQTSMESPAPVSSTDGSMPVLSPDAMTPNGVPRDVLEYALKGIQALIESTRAFHGIKDKRFIITNVFGTAHAQWGNLLTLAAVFRDPTLHNYVDERTLKELFQKTIAFFKIIAQPTSALAIDMRILEGLERELWGRRYGVGTELPVNAHTNSSFSSTTSGGPPPPAPHAGGPSSVGPPAMLQVQVGGPGMIQSGPGTPIDSGSGPGGMPPGAHLPPTPTLPQPLPPMQMQMGQPQQHPPMQQHHHHPGHPGHP